MKEIDNLKQMLHEINSKENEIIKKIEEQEMSLEHRRKKSN